MSEKGTNKINFAKRGTNKDKAKENGRKVERSISGNLSSFIHFTLEVVFIELFFKIDT